MNDEVSQIPVLNLLVLIRALRGSVGRWSGLGWLGGGLALVLYRRLGEIERRMAGLGARFRAGRLWRREGRSALAPGVSVGGARVRVLPVQFGWLVRMAAHEAAGFGSQLRAVLAHPEMRALLAAAPQVGRVLRPLCRMLAVEPEVLQVAAVDVVRVFPAFASDVVERADGLSPVIPLVGRRKS